MISKRYTTMNGRSVAIVTFTIPSSIWADSICLVGDFNGWNHHSHPFQQDHQGAWTIEIVLDVGRIYQFRYLCNGREWINDSSADGYVANPHGSQNSLVITDPNFRCHEE